MELHALSSAGKPLSTWTTRDAIQDCREACGGHGYLKGSETNYVYEIIFYYYNINCIKIFIF